MKIPRYIRNALLRRAYHGDLVNRSDTILNDWLKSRGVSSNVFESPYEINSIMLITEPYRITDRQIEILEALE